MRLEDGLLLACDDDVLVDDMKWAEKRLNDHYAMEQKRREENIELDFDRYRRGDLPRD